MKTYRNFEETEDNIGKGSLHFLPSFWIVASGKRRPNLQRQSDSWRLHRDFGRNIVVEHSIKYYELSGRPWDSTLT